MFRKSWLDKFLSRHGRKTGARPPRRQRLYLETLEDRRVPSAVTVSTSLDAVDGNTSSIAALISNPGVDGNISLREAILAGDNTPGANSIAFASTLSAHPILLTQGELLISNAVTITGLGAASSTVDAQHNSRIFDITAAAGAVTLDGLTLTNGQATAQNGGAIGSQSPALLTVRNSIIASNTATPALTYPYYGYGGALYTAGNVTVSNSTISGNNGSFFGGIDAPYGAVTLSDNSSVSDNVGGAMFAGAGATVSNSTIARNIGSPWGGLTVFGSLTVSYSTISGNSSAVLGGGIFQGSNFGDGAVVSISNSTISGNSSGGDGGGIYAESPSPVTISNSTLSDNHASRSGGAISAHFLTVNDSTIRGNNSTFGGGGGINSIVLTVNNSTISGNSASVGGGLSCLYLTLTNSTITGNSANFQGGGIYLNPDGSATISDSTISGNSAANGPGGGMYTLRGQEWHIVKGLKLMS
jgi:hypothetical protein